MFENKRLLSQRQYLIDRKLRENINIQNHSMHSILETVKQRPTGYTLYIYI